MPVAPTTAIIEIEISLGWAQENPELFLESVSQFVGDHPKKEWTRTVRTERKGFVFMRADRIVPEPVKDYPITAVKALAERYLRHGSNLPHRKRMLQLLLADLGLSKVADAMKAEDRCRLVDLFSPDGTILELYDAKA